VKRIALLLVGAYLFIAAGNRVAEHFGAMTCGCADDCWCHRRGLSLFRWVFPWRHHPGHTAEEKAGLDPTRT
jgi:hypothetical protein